MIQKKSFSDAIAANIGVVEELVGPVSVTKDGLMTKDYIRGIATNMTAQVIDFNTYRGPFPAVVRGEHSPTDNAEEWFIILGFFYGNNGFVIANNLGSKYLRIKSFKGDGQISDWTFI